MIDLCLLGKLSIGDLSMLLAERTPTWTGIHPSDWHYLLALFNSQLMCADRQAVTRDLPLLRRAYETLIEAARDGGAIDQRESVLRLVNLLVALAAISDSDEEIDDLVAEAKRVALENVPMSLESVQVKVRGWRTLPIKEIRDLRYAKNLLTPLGSIANRGSRGMCSTNFEAWMGLLSSLP
ncbi:hypothetical protein [Salinispora oceanensis]|uniref:hypothetical protein n=1 Tax=Salinispora oceanensis TaxID=1050199 RepID=UPI0009B76C2F|nr:hypothetical protein [Salinispora oceanensis]